MQTQSEDQLIEVNHIYKAYCAQISHLRHIAATDLQATLPGTQSSARNEATY